DNYNVLAVAGHRRATGRLWLSHGVRLHERTWRSRACPIITPVLRCRRNLPDGGVRDRQSHQRSPIMTFGIPRLATALVSGLIFGLGLSLSGMLDPVRVQGFLDVLGTW